MPEHFEIYIDSAEQYRWRARADNGLTIADSGQGYMSKEDCLAGITLMRHMDNAPVKDNA